MTTMTMTIIISSSSSSSSSSIIITVIILIWLYVCICIISITISIAIITTISIMLASASRSSVHRSITADTRSSSCSMLSSGGRMCLYLRQTTQHTFSSVTYCNYYDYHLSSFTCCMYAYAFLFVAPACSGCGRGGAPGSGLPSTLELRIVTCPMDYWNYSIAVSVAFSCGLSFCDIWYVIVCPDMLRSRCKRRPQNNQGHLSHDVSLHCVLIGWLPSSYAQGIYIYIYIYMFYVCVYMYVCVYIHIYTYITICIYVSLSLYIYICICMYVCIYIYIYIHTYMHTILYHFRARGLRHGVESHQAVLRERVRAEGRVVVHHLSYMCMCMCVYVYIYIYICMYMYV